MNEENTIRFSHRYSKLEACMTPGVDKATLLACIPVKLEELSPSFLEYDTHYYEGEDTDAHYSLPQKGGYLLLIFEPIYGLGLFTTLRRSTPEKAAYYRGAVGTAFDVVVEGEDKQDTAVLQRVADKADELRGKP